ncbi:hypothetical protein EJ07DRAFT_163004 [Lizonia empirigonia]|nr:hypothetical protein EJ07DRAFT_163004 [Lizonia empirigonia]
MRIYAIATVVGFSSLVSSQMIDLGDVNKQPLPSATSTLYLQTQSVVAAVMATPVADPGKESLTTRNDLNKHDGPAIEVQVLVPACQVLEGTLYDHPEDTVTDRVGTFLNDTSLQEQAMTASTPAGYTQVFQNLKNASQANGYMGYTILSTYNASECADTCTRTLGCQAFNLYFERGPSKVPGPDCRNPPALVIPFCALWGGPVSTGNALNEGQYREQFHVVIMASNGYIVNSSLNRLSSFAILAPLDCNGNDSYMGMRLLTDSAPFDRQRCAAICDATTQYNIDHPPANPATPPRLCKFYNTFILSKKFISQDQYCAMYSQYWDPEVYANNSGQYDGEGNHYTISSSDFFHNETDVTSPICPADIAGLQDDLIAHVFCSSYLSFSRPAQVSTTLTNTATFESQARRQCGTSCEAVVAVYPAKVADAAITASVPAEVTITAKDVSVAGAYSAATLEAMSQLDMSKTATVISPTDPPAPVMAPQATSMPVLDKRQTALIPALFNGRDNRDMSSACSQIVNTATATMTYFASIPATLSPVVDCSNVTLDDVYYNINLPFEICIYSTCSATVHPSSNRVMTLGGFATSEYNNSYYAIPSSGFPNETALFAYWDDLYMFPGQAQYMDYSICGREGTRTVIFSWKLGRYQTGGPVFDGRVWSFSATFFENATSRIVLDYKTIPDRGALASVGLQGPLGVCE